MAIAPLHPTISLINLYKATHGEIDSLESMIRGSNGTIEIVVHPYFESTELEMKPDYLYMLEGHLIDCQTDERPLLILEDKKYIKRLKSLLPELANTNYYIVPTHEGGHAQILV